jgi:very-short-patch-repair endonuclease
MSSFAIHPKAKYWSTKNNNILPTDVYKSSNNKYWFTCDICNHDFEIALYKVSIGRWCHYCSNKILCQIENCKICINKSFASHDKSKYWSQKNGNITPRDVFLKSDKKYWFKCNDCNHELYLKLSSISKGNWCSYCAHQQLCINDDCKFCYDNSFASQEKSKYWSDINDKIMPRNVFSKSDKKYWFKCGDCNHNFQLSLDNCYLGKWCSYCANKLLCNDDNCDYCFNKSAASNIKSKYWSSKNKNIIPRNIFKNSHKKYYYYCNECNNELYISPHNVNYGYWCKYCIYKTEKKLYDILNKKYNISKQYRVDWCKNIITKKYFPFDFVINDYNIIIELDGKQHFIQVSNWLSPEEQQERDLYKMKCANDNGFSVIRILQLDVWNDRYDWHTELLHNINYIIDNKIVQNIYMDKNDEYKYYKK